MRPRSYPAYVKAVGVIIGVITLVGGLVSVVLVWQGMMVLWIQSSPWQEKAVPLVFLALLLSGIIASLALLPMLIYRVLRSPNTSAR